ncbi:MAG: nucleotidyltransferase substrate binding protein [Bacilli bacterium]|nr:nucleotidyltransferase substrate binding protein [Bacilli bacterium]
MKNYLDKLDKYKKAVNFLTEMVNFESSFDTPLEKLNEALRDSIIYKFEFTFELAWKTIKEYLEKEGYEEINSPRKVLKQAFEINLIKDEEI